MSGVPKRSGRKSFYQEKANAQFLAEFFFNRFSKEEIMEAIKSGNHSVSEKMLAMAMDGDKGSIHAVFNKLFPDKMETSEDIKLHID